MHLPPRVFDTLVELVRSGGQLVRKDELMERVWPGTIVEEGSLGRTVSHLRKALGGAEFIQTVSKHGYRLAVPVQPGEPTASRCLAVLPLVAWGVEPALGLGIADALITGLTNSPDLELRPTSSIVKFAEARRHALRVGRQLGADLVLDGRLAGTATDLRATLQLLRVQDGQPLWADTVDGRQSALFAFQDQLLARVKSALGVPAERRVEKREPDPAAYRLYLQGRYHGYRYESASSKRALACFRQSIERDSGFAPAYAALAAAALIAAGYFLPAELLIPEARQAAKLAIELDPSLAEAHTSLGMVRFWHDWDRAGAEACFDRALELGSGDARCRQARGWFLTAMGRFDAAERSFEAAFELDPLSHTLAVDRGLPAFMAGRYEQALPAFREGIELDESSWYGHFHLGRALAGVGDYAGAEIALQAAAERSRDAIPEVPAALAWGEALSGQPEAARQRLRRWLERPDGPRLGGFEAAVVYTALDDASAAFAELWRAQRERDRWLGWIRADRRLERLRHDRQFAELLAAAGFGPSKETALSA